jgi:thiamine biosynthesis lipoprotein ApbE
LAQRTEQERQNDAQRAEAAAAQILGELNRILLQDIRNQFHTINHQGLEVGAAVKGYIGDAVHTALGEIDTPDAGTFDGMAR